MLSIGKSMSNDQLNFFCSVYVLDALFSLMSSGVKLMPKLSKVSFNFRYFSCFNCTVRLVVKCRLPTVQSLSLCAYISAICPT